jgi:hypothetical protein
MDRLKGLNWPLILLITLGIRQLFIPSFEISLSFSAIGAIYAFLLIKKEKEDKTLLTNEISNMKKDLVEMRSTVGSITLNKTKNLDQSTRRLF